MKMKWIDKQYHVHDNVHVLHQDVKTYCHKNQIPELLLYGTNSKPHSTRWLSKHYHLRFDPKIGNVICKILRIQCAYAACTSMLDKHCIFGITSDEEELYKPVNKCNCWPVLGSFKNWNIIPLSQKSTPSDAFDGIH